MSVEPQPTGLERTERLMQRLHDQGHVNLDAPLREVTPFLERKIQAVQSVHEDDWWWILVGSCGDDVCVFFGAGGDF